MQGRFHCDTDIEEYAESDPFHTVAEAADRAVAEMIATEPGSPADDALIDALLVAA
jgi:hypothetical protein